MRGTNRSRGRKLARALLLSIGTGVLVAPAEAGISFRAKPRPEASAYFVTEAVIGDELNGSFSKGILISTHLGFMVNQGERNAWGIAVSGDLLHESEGDDARVGVSARYRRWLSGERSVDVSLGRFYSENADDIFGIVSFNPNHWLGFGGQVERRAGSQTVFYSQGEFAVEEGADEVVFYPTVKLAGLPGLSMASALVVGVGVAIVLLVSGAG